MIKLRVTHEARRENAHQNPRGWLIQPSQGKEKNRYLHDWKSGRKDFCFENGGTFLVVKVNKVVSFL